MSSNTLSTLPIQRYAPIPEKLTVPLAEYKNAVAAYIPNHGVRFLKATIRTSEEMENLQGKRATINDKKKRRLHHFDYIFEMYYRHHISGEKEP
ncbi:hypothetical protein RMATCC62417_14713 [Rhizopus microsporus]|nr:hypothetical protein RMATCC62417_14713 [Rhizopus microsporus]